MIILLFYGFSLFILDVLFILLSLSHSSGFFSILNALFCFCFGETFSLRLLYAALWLSLCGLDAVLFLLSYTFHHGGVLRLFTLLAWTCEGSVVSNALHRCPLFHQHINIC